jgi:cell wall-associated NlpC family hydrolase
MSDISRIILNTMLYEINNSNTSKSVSNNESFSKLLQSSIGLLGSSSGVSSLGMIVTLTGLINQNRIYESNSNINNNLDSNNQTIQINNQNSNVNSNISASITTSVNNNTESINPNMDKAIKLLKEQVGKPYVWGANGPDSFDCSGLVRYIYKNALGKDIPRVSEDQSKVGQAVSREDLQPGDLVFFDTMDKGKVSHVGMYIGNNEFIHAANSKKGVIKSTLTGYYDKKFINARRP